MAKRSWINKLFTRSVTRTVRKAKRRTPLAVEALESRWVPSTFTVTSVADDGSTGTLRWAVGQANTNSGVADTIVFDNTVFATHQTITLASGSIAFTDTAATTMTGPAAGMTVSGNNASQVFVINSGASASLSGLTITGGFGSSKGGGVENSGTLTLTNCTVSGNTAVFQGGGIENYGALTLLGCTVTGNHATSSGSGGGINTQGSGESVTATNTTISNNTATLSGGGIAANGAVTLTNCTISGNTSGPTAGGILEYVSTMSLINCTVTGNQANSGGGLYMRFGSLNLLNVTISGNTATSSAGGISNTSGTGALTIGNTIVSANTAPTGPDINGSINTDHGHNLFGAALSGTTSGTGDLFTDSPQLATLGNYGGPTQTLASLPGSPAINAGSNTLGPSEVQTVTVTGSSGSFTLTFNAQTTGTITLGASAATVQSDLNGLTSILGVGGSVTVSKVGNLYFVTFGGSLGDTDVSQITGSGSGGATVATATLLDGNTDQRGVARSGTVDIGAFEGLSLYWDPGHTASGTGSGGTGTWDTSTANWFDGTSDVAWNNASFTTPIFAGSAGTVTLGTTITANTGLSFTTTGYTVTGSTLTLANSGGVLVSAGLSETIGSVITGTTGLTLTGGGTLDLTAANTWSGATTVNAGRLTFSDQVVPSTSIVINSGATLEYAISTGQPVQTTTTITGNGTLQKTGAGALFFGGGGAINWQLGAGALIDVQGGVFVGGNFVQDTWTSNLSSLNIASGAYFAGVEANVRVDALTGSGTLSTGYVGAGYTNFTVGVNNGTGTFAGTIIDGAMFVGGVGVSGGGGGPGNLVKTGTGTITLSGASTYTGTTTISAGTLKAGVANALSSSSAVTLANVAGATLNLNNFNVAIASLSGGGATGGNVTLGSGTLTTGDASSTSFGGVISGTGHVTKAGSGTFTLTRTNTWSGGTSVSAGTLLVTGTPGSGAIAIAGGATLNDQVINTGNSGVGSLRQAILNANLGSGAGTNEITFNIPGGGVQTITPTSALPNISKAVTLDGTTQPGYSSSPLIEVTGTSAGAAVSGLTLAASSITVRGLEIDHFQANGVLVQNGVNNVLIGGTGAGQGNVIASNTLAGVAITGASSSGDAVRGNSIYGNGTVGINLAAAGNHNQAVPTVLAAAVDPLTSGNPTFAGTTMLKATFTGAPNTTYALDFFDNFTTANSHQGQTYLGTVTITTNAGGLVLTTDGAGNPAPASATFYALLANAPTPGDILTITATDASGNTSQFSADVTSILRPEVNVTGLASAVRGQRLTYTLTPDATDVAAGLHYTVDFGDASTPQTFTSTAASLVTSGHEFTLASGTPYTITATVSDQYGFTSSGTTTTLVSTFALENSNTEIDVGGQFGGSGSYFLLTGVLDPNHPVNDTFNLQLDGVQVINYTDAQIAPHLATLTKFVLWGQDAPVSPGNLFDASGYTGTVDIHNGPGFNALVGSQTGVNHFNYDAHATDSLFIIAPTTATNILDFVGSDQGVTFDLGKLSGQTQQVTPSGDLLSIAASIVGPGQFTPATLNALIGSSLGDKITIPSTYGSAFTAANKFSVTGGAGNDTFTIGAAGSANDTFTIQNSTFGNLGGNDTFTIGGPGSAGNDTFTIQNSTFSAGTGNDTFTISGSGLAGTNDTFTIGAGTSFGGNDTFTIGGPTGLGSNDTFTINNAGSFAGNDTFTIGSAAAGNDTFTINNTFSGSAGNDTFAIRTLSAGNDTFTINGGPSAGLGNDTFTIGSLGTGNDTFTITGVGAPGSTGNDTFTIGNFGTGNDTFTIGGLSAAGSTGNDTFTIGSFGAGNDTFTITGTTVGGLGNDTFTIQNAGTGNDTFTIGNISSAGSTGNDTFTIGNAGVGQGNDTFTIGNITAGTGNDTFTIGSASAGNDTFTINSINAGGSVGNDTFTIGNSGVGNDTFTIGAITSGTGNDTFTIAAGGNDTFTISGGVNLGTGNDTFTINNLGSATGNDTFTINGSLAGQGNDTFTIQDLGAGQSNDTFTINGGLTGAGNDTFTILSQNAGNDTFTITGGLVAGTGNDTFTIGSLGAGNDTFTIGNISAAGSTGNDTFTIAGSSTGIDTFTIGNITAGTGNDSFTIGSAGVGNDTFTIGNVTASGIGNDTFQIGSSGTGQDTFTIGSITSGVGNDTFTISGTGNDTFTISGGVNLGTGNDTFTINNLGSATGNDTFTINGSFTGQGNDTFTIQDLGTGQSNDTFTINGSLTGAGNDTFTILTQNAGNDTFLITGGVTAGTGNDTFTIGSLGAGNDTFTIGNLNAGSSTGNDTFTIAGSSTGNDTFTIGNMTAGTGNDTFTIGSAGAANDTFTIGNISALGTGNDSFKIGSSGTGQDTFTIGSITSGAGNDTFTISAGGNDTFTISGGVNLGTGNDTFTINNLGSATGNDTFTINGSLTGQGNDTFTIQDLGTGQSNDTFTINGSLTGAGNDTFTILSQNAGNDTFTITGGLTAGTGNDTFIIGSAGTGNDTFTIGNISAASSTGNDTFTIAGSSTGNDTFTIGNITAGTGNDSFTIGSAGAANDTFTIGNISALGTGNDSFKIGSSGTGQDTFTIGSITSGAGNDTFTISGTGNDTFTISGGVNSGLGNDTFTITNLGSAAGNDTFTINGSFAGQGNDTFTIQDLSAGQSNDTFTINGSLTGAGNDTFTILSLNAGNDTFTITGSLNAGTGNDTFVIGSAGTGNDTFTIGNLNAGSSTGNDTFTIAGSSTGNDTFTIGNITAGTGNDSFTIGSAGAANDTFTIGNISALGTGNDSFKIGSSGTGQDTFTIGSITSGAANDTFTISGGGNDTFTITGGVNSGTGNDVFILADLGTAAATDHDTFTITGSFAGQGNDTFVIEDAGTSGSTDAMIVNGSLTGGRGGQNAFDLATSGSDNATITINGSLTGGASGRDLFEINNNGSGNNTFTVTGGIHDAGTGNDIFLLSNIGNGNNTFTLKGGITLGTGDDLFSINTLGSGNNTILLSGNVVLGNADDTFFTISQSGDGNNTITIDGSVTAGNGNGFMTLGTSGAGTDSVTVTGAIAFGSGTDSFQINGSGTGSATFNLQGGVTGQGYDTFSIQDPGALTSAGASLTVNGNLGGGKGNNTFLVSSGLNYHAGPDHFALNGNLTGGSGFNAFQVTNSGLSTNSFAFTGTLQGGANDQGDDFQLAGLYDTVHLASGTGAGSDSYEFAGGIQGRIAIAAPNASTRTDNLDFSTLNSGVSVNLGSTAAQQVAPGLTLQLSDASGLSGVIGTAYNDTIQGNARTNTLAGSSALDSQYTASAPGVFANGKTQVVLLDFDTATQASNGVYDFNSFYATRNVTPLRTYTPDDRQAILQIIKQDYAPFLQQPGQSGGLYFTLDPNDPVLLATSGKYITEYFNQSVPSINDGTSTPLQLANNPNETFGAGGTSNNLDFRDADMTGAAFIQVNGIVGEPLQPAATEQNWRALSAKIAAHELGHLLGLHHADSFGPIGQGVYPVPGPGYNPAYPGPFNASETFDHIITSGDSVGADRWNDLRKLFFGEREDVTLAFSFTAPTTPADGTLLVSQHGQPALASPQALSLQSMLVPNTETYGRDAGRTLEVQAVDVLGTLGLDATGHAEKDYYTFTGNAGDVMNVNVMSDGISRYARSGSNGYIDPQVTLYQFNADGTLTQVAFNDDVFPSSASGDSSLVDVVLPATGTYVIKVNSFAYASDPHLDTTGFSSEQLQNYQDAVNGTDTGHYELFLYRFKAGAAQGGSDTFIAGTGPATILAGPSNSASLGSLQAVPLNTVVGNTLNVPLATFTAPTGSGTYTALINWGDQGTPSQGVVQVNGSTVTILGNHTYAHPGTYPLALTLSSGSGVSVNVSEQVVISPDATTTTLVSSPTVFGQTATLTAVVAPQAPGSGTPIGSVDFYDATAHQDLGQVALQGGQASLTTSALAVGSHTITLTYTTADGNFLSGQGSGTQVVNRAATTVAVVSSTNGTSVSGQAVTFTATVAVTSPGTTVNAFPGATLTFYDGTQAISPAVAVGTTGGVTTASFTTSILSTASHTIKAVYSGDGNVVTSTSAALTQAVNPASTTTAVATSLSPTVSGQSVTFTATVSLVSPGTAAVANPSGTVTFKDGATTLGTGTVSTTAGVTTASYTTSLLSTASHTITAVYSGDTNFATSTSSGLTQVVNRAATTTALASSINPVAVGQPVTFTATVSATSPGGTAFANPTGSVTFKDGITTLGTGTLSTTSGITTATFSTSTLSAGSHTITAVFSGDTNFITSTSAGLTEAVAGIILLDSTASGALTLTGNAAINTNYSVIVDSNSSSAVTASGNASVHALNIQVAGGVHASGQASLNPGPVTGAAVLADPLKNLAGPGVTGLTNYGAANYGGSSTVTLNPGIYSQIKISGSANVTMLPGIYVIEGGGFSVSGSASVTGDGILIYNAGSNYPSSGGTFGAISLSGSGTVHLTPATGPTNPYSGILIFQSRENTRALALGGNAVLGVSGMIYAANAQLALSGNAQLNTAFVVDRLSITGNGVSTEIAGTVNGQDVNNAGTLLGDNLEVYVDNTSGFFTADAMNRIQDAINAWDQLLAPYNVVITEVADPALANVVIDAGATSAAGSHADGVLGSYSSSGEITILLGWNWYTGAAGSQIGAGQYDFQTVVTHELGHALGLGGSDNSTSPMDESLDPGVVRRVPTTPDLNIPEAPDGADPERASVVPAGDWLSDASVVRMNGAEMRSVTVAAGDAATTEVSTTSEACFGSRSADLTMPPAAGSSFVVTPAFTTAVARGSGVNEWSPAALEDTHGRNQSPDGGMTSGPGSGYLLASERAAVDGALREWTRPAYCTAQDRWLPLLAVDGRPQVAPQATPASGEVVDAGRPEPRLADCLFAALAAAALTSLPAEFLDSREQDDTRSRISLGKTASDG